MAQGEYGSVYPVTVLRALGREVHHVLRASTPTHAALRDRVAGIAILSLLIDLICAVLALLLERHVPQTDIQSFGSALFWTTTQLLTISSQIHNPLSFGGRILDVFMEAYAMIVVASLAGSMGAFLIKKGQEADAAAKRAH